MAETLYLSKKKKGGSVMDSSPQIKAIRLMSVFKNYDLAIYHAYEFMEFYFLVEPSIEKRKYWMDVIDYLTEEKNNKKEVFETQEQFISKNKEVLWFNVWKDSVTKEYLVTFHSREDVADKVIEDELKDIHIKKFKIEL